MLGHARGRQAAARLRRKRFSPSLFVVHFSTRGEWPDTPHHSILFGPRYKELLGEIYRGSTLPDDPSIYLHHPTATDPAMAPAGKSTFYALAPVPHLGKAPLDWETEGSAYAARILQILEERALPGLSNRLEILFHFGPAEFESDLNSHLGSAFSLEPLLTQSAWFRVHNRDDEIPNLYFVGAGTHPGAGIPGVVGSAKATAGLVIEDLLG
ncbi:MAG TPA: phytoene desaturase family protein, partial [Allosphingosinicella sp.]|jgi:phytoene desaturase